MARSKKVTTDVADAPTQATPQTPAPITVSATDLATALAAAIEVARPAVKTLQTRKKNNPWAPKDGSPKLKLKRKLYQHSILLHEDRMTNEEIALANKLRPGVYMDNFVKVIRRRDKGIDIDYPFKSHAQRAKLGSSFGITTFRQLLERLVEEGQRPKKQIEDFDDF